MGTLAHGLPTSTHSREVWAWCLPGCSSSGVMDALGLAPVGPCVENHRAPAMAQFKNGGCVQHVCCGPVAETPQTLILPLILVGARCGVGGAKPPEASPVLRRAGRHVRSSGAAGRVCGRPCPGIALRPCTGAPKRRITDHLRSICVRGSESEARQHWQCERGGVRGDVRYWAHGIVYQVAGGTYTTAWFSPSACARLRLSILS